MRWWQDVAWGVENDGWAVDVGGDGKVAVYGDVTADRSGSWMLDGVWNFIWDDCGEPVEEDAEVGEVMSLIPLADGIWSEVVLNDEKKSWWKGGDAVNVCDFGGAVHQRIKQKFLMFWVEGCCCGWQWFRWRWLGRCLNWKKVWPGYRRWRWWPN